MSFKSLKTLTFQRRQDSSTSHHCCVPLCTASARFNSVLSFHTFPREPDMQRRWVDNIRRDNFTITNHTRVCSRHFLNSDLVQPQSNLGRRRLKAHAEPVLFQWNNFTLQSPWHRGGHSVDVIYQDHNYCSTTGSAVLQYKEDKEEERPQLQLEKRVIRIKFGLGRFATSDDDIRFYTRFASHDHLMAFWRQIEPAIHKMVRVTGAGASAKTNDVPLTGTLMPLQPIDEFFLFMTYLSLGQMENNLTLRFNIHQSVVSSIITTWANFLYSVLGSVSIWMSDEAVKAHLPDAFKDYPDTQVVLKYTNLHCQTPDSPLLQTEAFSKSFCTFKGLIGMAPHGAVTFVSALYADSVSDLKLLKQSGIASLLEPTMAIMVDEGFPVEDCVPCKVYTPALLARRGQLSAPEGSETRSDTALRTHIERLVHRVKDKHKIFNTIIPLSVSGSINQLHTVACLLVNYQNGPLV